MAILMLMVLWYAFAANAVVATSYHFSDALDGEIKLNQEIEALEASLAVQATPEALEGKAKTLGFSRITAPKYLSVPGDTVARR